MKLLSFIFSILLWVWQLPQHIIALVIMLINIKSLEKRKYKDDVTYYVCDYLYNCGISLGNYIFLDKDVPIIDSRTFYHEYGHSRQSKYLGWFYLLIIGLPSLLTNICCRLLSKINDNHYKTCKYYKMPWEAWADKLGGVDRSDYDNWVKI